MGPTYRIAILINGICQWLELDGKVYETCLSERANRLADEQITKGITTSAIVISSWDHQWKLPEVPKLPVEDAVAQIAKLLHGRPVIGLFSSEWKIAEILMKSKHLKIVGEGQERECWVS